jgi:hypothetical protein
MGNGRKITKIPNDIYLHSGKIASELKSLTNPWMNLRSVTSLRAQRSNQEKAPKSKRA